MIFKKLLLISLLSILSACIYKTDVYQGNVLETTQIDQLHVGMRKSQVIDLLGTPQVTDPFHTQRWDYFSFSQTDNRRKSARRIVTLIFDKDRLIEIKK